MPALGAAGQSHQSSDTPVLSQFSIVVLFSFARASFLRASASRSNHISGRRLLTTVMACNKHNLAIYPHRPAEWIKLSMLTKHLLGKGKNGVKYGFAVSLPEGHVSSCPSSLIWTHRVFFAPATTVVELRPNY